MKILLTGTRAPATLDLARRLAAQGATVIGADSGRFPLGRWSRAYAQHVRVPPPRQQTAAYIASIQTLMTTHAVDLLWPTCEEIFALAGAWDTLSAACPLTRLFFPPLADLLPLHDKGAFAHFVSTLHHIVRSPVTTSVGEAAAGADLIWKPAFSRFGTATRFDTPPPSPHGWIAQERIRGEEFSSYALAVDGLVTVQSFYRAAARFRRGASCAFVPHEDARAADFVRTVAQRLHFTGQLAFDFIERSSDQKLFVIECNPRLTSGIHTLHPSTDLHSATEVTASPLPPLPPHAAQLGLATLLSAPQVWGRSPDVVWSVRDPWPMLTQGLSFAEFLTLALRHRCPLAAAMTWDIEFNGD
jgi:ATP-grasp domain